MRETSNALLAAGAVKLFPEKKRAASWSNAGLETCCVRNVCVFQDVSLQRDTGKFSDDAPA